MVFVFLFLTWTSLSMIISRSIHVAANGIISFFIMAQWWFYIYMYIYRYHIFFIHSSASGHLGCFHVLTIVNSAAMNIGVHLSFKIIVFSGCVPRSEIASSYGHSIFSFFSSFHSVFHSGNTNLYSHQRYRRWFLCTISSICYL